MNEYQARRQNGRGCGRTLQWLAWGRLAGSDMALWLVPSCLGGSDVWLFGPACPQGYKSALGMLIWSLCRRPRATMFLVAALSVITLSYLGPDCCALFLLLPQAIGVLVVARACSLSLPGSSYSFLPWSSTCWFMLPTELVDPWWWIAVSGPFLRGVPSWVG